MELHAGLVLRLVGAVAGYAHVACRHAAYRAAFGEQDFGGSEARIDFDAKYLGLIREPATNMTEAHDVIALVIHQSRQHPIRNPIRAMRGQYQEAIVGDGRVERRATGAPIRNQLVERNRIDDSAGKNVGADLRAFFEDANGDLAALLLRDLLQANGCRQARRTTPDDNHVVVHRFARHAPPGKALDRIAQILALRSYDHRL